MKTEKDLIFADEVYEIIGMMYEVYDSVGYGHKENFYQKAVAEIFEKNKKKFDEQLRVKVKMGETVLGEYRFDFLYEDKIVIELKQGESFLKNNIEQVYAYLKARKLKLGLLINFTKKGIKFKRIVNLY